MTVAIPANPAATELEKDVATEQSLRGDMLKIAEETRQLQERGRPRGLQRDVLATMVSAVEQKIQDRRRRLDAVKRADSILPADCRKRSSNSINSIASATRLPTAGGAGGRRELSDADERAVDGPRRIC